MASPEVDIQGARAKIRDVGLVVLFCALTFGLVYPQVWYYRINRELRDFGRVYQNEKLANSNPVLSVLAVTLGALLIVPPIVSYYRTTARIRQAQRIVNTELTNGWVIFACYLAGAILVLPLLVIPGYVQGGLNRVWSMFPRVLPASQVQPPAIGAPMAGSQQGAPAPPPPPEVTYPPPPMNPAQQPPPPPPPEAG